MNYDVNLIKDIITNPNKALSEYHVNIKDLFVVYIVSLLIYVVGGSFVARSDVVLALAVIFSISMFIGVLWAHIFVKLFGKSGIFKTLKIITFSFVPLLIIGWIPVIGPISILLGIIIIKRGLEIVHGFSTKKSIIITLIIISIPLLIIVLSLAASIITAMKAYSIVESYFSSIPKRYLNTSYSK